MAVNPKADGMVPRLARQAMTLFELIIVLAIFLIVSSLTIPVISTMLEDNRVRAARDHVRARWADMRSRAMQEGQPYKFSILENTGRYRIEPAGDGTFPILEGVSEGELPEGVLFAKDANLLARGAVTLTPGNAFETVAVYLADGSGRDDVAILFGKPGAGVIGLRLRALTGAISSVDPALEGNRP